MENETRNNKPPKYLSYRGCVYKRLSKKDVTNAIEEFKETRKILEAAGILRKGLYETEMANGGNENGEREEK